MLEIANSKITHEIYQKGIYLRIFHDLKFDEINYICYSITKLIK